MVREVAHAREQNPLSDLNKILQGGSYPDVITYTNFGEDRLGVLGWWGPKLALLHRLSLSPLQHSCTTVRVCDVNIMCLHKYIGLQMPLMHRICMPIYLLK